MGVQAQPGWHGVCPRGAATRQQPRPEGPRCPATLAHHLVPRPRRDLAAWCTGTLRALAKAGGCGAQVTGMVEATDLETTAAYEGCGHVSRPRHITATHGHGRAIAGTVDGGKPMVLIEAMTKMPLAGTVVPIHAPAGLSRRALVTPGPGESGRHRPAAPGSLGSGVWGWGLRSMRCGAAWT